MCTVNEHATVDYHDGSSRLKHKLCRNNRYKRFPIAIILQRRRARIVQ